MNHIDFLNAGIDISRALSGVMARVSECGRNTSACVCGCADEGNYISNHNLGQGHEISLLERLSDGMKSEFSTKTISCTLATLIISTKGLM